MKASLNSVAGKLEKNHHEWNEQQKNQHVTLCKSKLDKCIDELKVHAHACKGNVRWSNESNANSSFDGEMMLASGCFFGVDTASLRVFVYNMKNAKTAYDTALVNSEGTVDDIVSQDDT